MSTLPLPMSFDVICIGDVSIDEFLKVDDAQIICDVNRENCQICFNYADKIPVSEFRNSLGGNSANVAAGLVKLGLKTSVYAELGDDTNADRFFTEFKQRGVDTSLLKKTKGESTNIHEVIVYKEDRTILSYHKNWDYTLPLFEEPTWIHYSSLASNFAKVQQELMTYLANHPKTLIAFNPGTYHLKAGLDSFRDILKVTDALFLNKEEAKALCTKISSLAELHEQLQGLGPKMTIITDAENGASVATNTGDLIQDTIFIIKKPILDKTGAGDAFTSGFLGALIHKKSLKTALKWGLINSSSVIREIGPMNGLQTLSGIQKLS
jgi:sugar/nucleoside kinase (ribokinase family)